MSLETFEKILESVGYVKTLYPFGVGEPLLHPQYDKLIQIASEHSSFTNINTNGLHMDRVNIERLNASGLSELTLSLDGATAEGYLAIRQGSDFNQVLKGLELYQEVGEVPIKIFSVIGGPNLDSVLGLPALANRYGVKTLEFNIVHPPPGRSELLPPIPDLKRVLARLHSLCDDIGLKTNLEGLTKDAPLSWCAAPFKACFVDAEGYLAPCCNYPHFKTTQILDRGFPAAWNGPELRDFRSRVMAGDFPSWCVSFCLEFRRLINSIK
jgi:MoaA/NifB/PqqE/SkfB family radical SAM enzyme